MQLLECPQCGTPISSEDIDSEHQQLILAAGSLIAAAALVGLMLEHPDYAIAQPGFTARMKEVTELLRGMADEMGQWGEAFDSDED